MSFQNKRALGPPARKRLQVEELKKGESWRTGLCDSQVGQVFFYLVAAQLLHIKNQRRPHVILGLFCEGEDVYIIGVWVF